MWQHALRSWPGKKGRQVTGFFPGLLHCVESFAPAIGRGEKFQVLKIGVRFFFALADLQRSLPWLTYSAYTDIVSYSIG